MRNTVLIRHINRPELNLLTAPQDRLFRPSICWKRTARLAALSVFACVSLSVAALAIYSHMEGLALSRVQESVMVLRSALFLWVSVLIVFSNQILIQSVLLYQRYASADLRLRCCQAPSCSSFAISALQSFGPIVGSFQAISRMRNCGRPHQTQRLQLHVPVPLAAILNCLLLSSLFLLISLSAPNAVILASLHWYFLVAVWLACVAGPDINQRLFGAINLTQGSNAPRSTEQLVALISICESQPGISPEVAQRLKTLKARLYFCASREPDGGSVLHGTVPALVDRFYLQMMSGKRELLGSSLELLESSLSKAVN